MVVICFFDFLDSIRNEVEWNVGWEVMIICVLIGRWWVVDGCYCVVYFFWYSCEEVFSFD